MMKMIIASATLAAFAAPALAQQPTTTMPAKPHSMTEDTFTKHDADKNGSLSLDEVKVADASVTAADLDKYDADKDKSLSKAEFAMWTEAKATPPASAPGK